MGEHVKDRLFFIMNYYAIILSKLVGLVFNDVHFYKRQVLCGVGRGEDWVLQAVYRDWGGRAC